MCYYHSGVKMLEKVISKKEKAHKAVQEVFHKLKKTTNFTLEKLDEVGAGTATGYLLGRWFTGNVDYTDLKTAFEIYLLARLIHGSYELTRDLRKYRMGDGTYTCLEDHELLKECNITPVIEKNKYKNNFRGSYHWDGIKNLTISPKIHART